MRTPAARKRASRSATISRSASNALSVISTVTRLGSMPARVDLFEQPILIARPRQVLRQQVDRDIQVLERAFPDRGLAQRLALHQPRQALGQAACLGPREQFLRRSRAIPARKRLGADDLAGRRLDLGLEQDGDRLVRDDRFELAVAATALRAPDQAGPTPAAPTKMRYAI